MSRLTKGLRNRRRLIAIAAVGATVSLILSACDNPGSFAPIAISRQGNTLLIAVCTRIQVKHFSVEERDVSAGVGWHDIFDAKGDVPIESGDIIRIPGGIQGLNVSKSTEPSFSPTAAIGLLFEGVASQDTFSTGYDSLAGLESNKWTTPNGSTRHSPCP